MVKGRSFKEPKRLREIAMMKLIDMLFERFIPHIFRLYQDTDSEDGFDAIREEALVVRDWMYEPLSCSVANDVQELIMKALLLIKDFNRSLLHPSLKYVELLVPHPKCQNLNLEFLSDDVIGDVIDMLQSLICLEYVEWTVRLERIEIDQFTTNLKYFTRLKVFVHQLDCNDEIIKVLSDNCPQLSVLDVEDSSSVTDESTHYIKNMKSLKKCYIKYTSITMEGVVCILKNCTQLCELDMNYDMCKILDILEDADNPLQLSLRTVELCTYPITPRFSVQWRSEPPCHISNVERLTIKYVSCCYSALDTWLILENINVIALDTFVMSCKDLVELSNGCQNITELYVTVMDHDDTNNTYSLSEHRPFQKLKILGFKIVQLGPKWFRETDASILKILLSYSTMVTHVRIKNLHINDDTVETIFRTNKMRYLQYWEMKETLCTDETFFLLFRMCPMLKFIGTLRTWEIDPDKVQEIENFIRQGNYNLDIDMSDHDAILIRYTSRTKELLLKMGHEM